MTLEGKGDDDTFIRVRQSVERAPFIPQLRRKDDVQRPPPQSTSEKTYYLPLKKGGRPAEKGF